MKIPELTEEQYANLLDAYVNQMIEDMDTDALCQYAFDTLFEAYEQESQTEIVNQVYKRYPHLLEDINE